MKIPRCNAHVALAALTAAAMIAPAALGAGEPKNQLPFTQPSTGATVAAHTVRLTSGTATSVITGEPKNELPFTRPSNDDPGLARALREVSRGIPAPTGEPKSEPPFTLPAPSRPTVVVPGRAFDWTDAAIGALATIGIGLAGVGIYVLVSTARPQARAGAVRTNS